VSIKKEENMPRYLDPKNDLIFKKVFGEHKNLCISLLNSLLKFKGSEQIESIEYDSGELLPEIPALKDTIVDVRCKDKTGRQFIVEMQMNWTREFQQRVLLNASKAYVRQVDKGAEYELAQPVYSLNLVNDIFEESPEMANVYYHYYKIVNIENTEKQIKGLEFVFVELPKYKPCSKQEQDYFDLWLRFLTEINEKTGNVPEDFLNNKEIMEAVKYVEESSLTKEELDIYDRVWDAVKVRRTLISGAIRRGEARGEARGLAKGRKEGIKEGEARGEARGRKEGMKEGEAKGRKEGIKEGGKQKTLEIAKNMKKRGMSKNEISEMIGLSIDEIDKL
jgi:predicted transposase/invertase (TIGR01784 family)